MTDCIAVENELHIKIACRRILDKVLIREDKLIQDLRRLCIDEALKELIRNTVTEAPDNLGIRNSGYREDRSVRHTHGKIAADHNVKIFSLKGHDPSVTDGTDFAVDGLFFLFGDGALSSLSIFCPCGSAFSLLFCLRPCGSSRSSLSSLRPCRCSYFFIRDRSFFLLSFFLPNFARSLTFRIHGRNISRRFRPCPCASRSRLFHDKSTDILCCVLLDSDRRKDHRIRRCKDDDCCKAEDECPPFS